MRHICIRPWLLVAMLSVTAAGLSAAERPDWRSELQPETDAWKKIKQEFIFNNGAEPKTLDPALMTGSVEGRIALGLFEGLVGLHPETLEAVPGLAESWQVSDDGLIYTFTLRANAKWSNGDAVTAQDVAGSWKRVLTPATGSEYVYQLFPIKNAQAWFKKEVSDFKDVGIKVLDSRKLQVTLGGPCPYFLDLVAFQTLYPVHLPSIEKHGDNWTKPGNLISNGPFTLAEWQPRNFVKLVKNPHYHDADFVKLQSVIIRPYDDAETAIKLFRNKELHWQNSIPTSKVDELKFDNDYYFNASLSTYFYRFNVAVAPFEDVKVRKALAMAINREIITKHLLKAGQIPAHGLCPKNCGGYQPGKGIHYDKEAARKLLAESSYGPGKKPMPKITLLYNTSEDHKKVAENVKEQWEKNLGVKVELANSEWKVYLDRMTKKDYQLMRSGWIGDYNDPNTFFDMFVTGGGNNRTNWSNARYDELLKQSMVETDKAKRLEIFKQMDHILCVEECPIVPIYFNINQGMISPKVGGFFPNIREYHPFQYIWIDEEE